MFRLPGADQSNHRPGLRADLERLEGGIEISALIESLRKNGVKEEITSTALAEAQGPKET